MEALSLIFVGFPPRISMLLVHGAEGGTSAFLEMYEFEQPYTDVQADKQWRSILTGMCSQYAHAITSGYPCDMNADQLHRSSDGSTELRPHDLSTSTSAPISKPSHMASMAVSAGNRGDDVVSIGPGCSGYIEVPLFGH